MEDVTSMGTPLAVMQEQLTAFGEDVLPKILGG
jgi:hypothetical protein